MWRCTGQRGRTALHEAAASNSADAARALIEAGCALDTTDEVPRVSRPRWQLELGRVSGGVGWAGRERQGGAALRAALVLTLYPEL